MKTSVLGKFAAGALLFLPAMAMAIDCEIPAQDWALRQLLLDYPDLGRQNERQVIQSTEQRRLGAYYVQFVGGEVYVVETYLRDEDGECAEVFRPWRFVPSLSIDLRKEVGHVSRLLPRGPGFELVLPEGIESIAVADFWADAECNFVPVQSEDRVWVDLIAGDDGSGCTLTVLDEQGDSRSITVYIGD